MFRLILAIVSYPFWFGGVAKGDIAFPTKGRLEDYGGKAACSVRSRSSSCRFTIVFTVLRSIAFGQFTAFYLCLCVFSAYLMRSEVSISAAFVRCGIRRRFKKIVDPRAPTRSADRRPGRLLLLLPPSLTFVVLPLCCWRGM